MKKWIGVCLIVASLSFVFVSKQATGEETRQDPEKQHEFMLGEWCGKIDELQYTWIHTINKDGTFSTYFESYPNADDSFLPYVQFGTWSIDAGRFVELIASFQDIGGPTEYVFPPDIYWYGIVELTEHKKKLFYPEWGIAFVSTRNCAPLLG